MSFLSPSYERKGEVLQEVVSLQEVTSPQEVTSRQEVMSQEVTSIGSGVITGSDVRGNVIP